MNPCETALLKRRDLLRGKIAAEEQLEREFFSNFNHELRTPLNTVLGYAQLLSTDERLAEPQREDMLIIADNAQYLLGLVEDILNLEISDFGKLSLELEEFSLSQLWRRIDPILRTMLQPSVRLETSFSADADLIRADRRKLRQILLNVVGNATKYTPTGTITIRSERGSDGELLIWIEDSGIGIDEATLEKLFTPYCVGQHGHPDSTGLGLLLVKELVELHSGRIVIDSSSGQGTRLLLAIPSNL